MVRPLILIADHNPFVRKSIREALASLEVDIREALSGSELLEIARDFLPNAIILETDLPGPGGRSVLKSIKGVDGLRYIPIIFLEKESTTEGKDLYVEGIDSHIIGAPEAAFDIVRRPFKPAKFIEAVQRALLPAQTGVGDKDIETKPALTEKVFKVGDPVSWVSENHRTETDKSRLSEFTEADFQRFQDFLLRKVGLYFDIKRKRDLAKALKHRMVALGMDVYLDYFQYLNHSQHEEKELRNLVLYITIGETTFFRSPDQFKAMREYILPRLLADRRKIPKPSLRIWSAGCSTGEEPYSIAITLKEVIPDFDRWDIHISATDLNQKFLRFAQEGLYPPRKVRFVKDDILRRYFKKEEGHYRVIPEIRKMVKFSYQNLSVDTYDQFDGSDVVFCRNVLIYFRRDRIPSVIDRFNQILQDDGYLILGYSETLFQISEDFDSVHYGDAFFYIKTDQVEEPKKPVPEKTETEFAFKWPEIEPAPPTESKKDPRHIEKIEPSRSDMRWRSIGHRHLTKPLPPTEREFTTAEHAVSPAPSARPLDGSITERDALWEEGLNYYFYEQFDDAEEVFEELAKKYPNCARAKLGAGFIHANRGEDTLAVLDIEKALEMNNLLPEAYYLRALIEEKNGDVEAAMADYRNVILLDPDFAMAHFNLGILYMKQGRIRDSRREFHNTLNILESYAANHGVKFSGGLHREALMQLCGELGG